VDTMNVPGRAFLPPSLSYATIGWPPKVAAVDFQNPKLRVVFIILVVSRRIRRGQRRPSPSPPLPPPSERQGQGQQLQNQPTKKGIVKKMGELSLEMFDGLAKV